ncbi:cupin domain-containing protein [bacterium]|nr:cupin domain-containing protein [bacterium]
MKEIEVRKITEDEKKKLKISQWPIWTCGVSAFDWHYDETESCLILEGDVTVKTASGSVRFGAGDFVRFQKGLSCTWEVAKPVRKHYSFDE